MGWLAAWWDRLRHGGWRLDPEARARLEIHGHRGAAGLAPENSAEAVEAAIALGVDAVELDVRLSCDGQPVVWHDAYLTAQKCRLVEPDAGLPDPARLAAGDPRLWVRHLRAVELARYGILTLDALFELVAALADDPNQPAATRRAAGQVRFNLEIKREQRVPAGVATAPSPGAPGSVERAVVERVIARGLEARTLVQSFDTDSVRAVGELAPRLDRAVLERRARLDLEAVAGWGVGTWAVHHSQVDQAALTRARAAGLRTLAWTVNDRKTMRRLIDLGVDGLITDRPDLLLSGAGSGRF